MKIFSFGFLFYGLHDGKRGWIRFFGSDGAGLKWRHKEFTDPLFSERMGFEKKMTLGKWVIGILKRRGT